VPFEERAVRRCLVDVALVERDAQLGQITSGVPARRSRGFAVEDGCAHRRLVLLGPFIVLV